MTAFLPRPATRADTAPLIALWHQGWHDAHAAHVLPAITARRTPDFFETHLPRLGDGLRVAGPIGAPMGSARPAPHGAGAAIPPIRQVLSQDKRRPR